MPLYEYQCDACGARFELIRKFSDPPLEVCPTCGKGPVQKLISSPAFQFKGSGWYITDYARKSGGGEGKTGESTGDSKTSSSATESKTAPDSSGAKESTASDKPAPAASTTTKDS